MPREIGTMGKLYLVKTIQFGSSCLVNCFVKISSKCNHEKLAKKKNHAPKLTRSKVYTSQWTSIQMKQPFGMEAVEPYIGLYTFTIE